MRPDHGFGLARVVAAGLALLVAGAALASAGHRQAPCDGLFLIPEQVLPTLGSVTPIHQYPEAVLARVADPDHLPAGVLSRLHPVAEMGRVSFRAWSAGYAAPDASKTAGLPGGYYVVALAGPVDAAWPDRLQQLGLQVVGTAWPYALVVRADGAGLRAALELETSAGFMVVRGVLALPAEARLSRALSLGHPAGALQVRVTTFREEALAGALAALQSEPAASHKRLGPRTAVIWVEAGHLRSRVAQLPEVAVVEPVHDLELHNNLVPRPGLLEVEPVWTELGCNGTGIIVAHNDSGVDLEHADFPAGTIAATIGRMTYTDTGHGTHTAGSIVGRGSRMSPVNGSGCGDLTEPMATVRGMAWGATLVSNNLFDGGLAEVQKMMQWAAQQGAWISSNSWGHRGDLTNVAAYAASSVAVDIAVRDADPATAEAEPLAIFFSAGNLGPRPGTVSSPGNAKNAVTVGASQNDRCGVWVPDLDSGPDVNAVISISGRGPSQGRIKPDLVAPGSDVLSTESDDWLAIERWDDGWTGDDYALGSGTSMACALAAGAAAVFAEHYWRNFAARPSPALIKAALINGAVDTGLGYPSTEQGWGRLNLRRAVAGPPGGRIHFMDQAAVTPLITGASWDHELVVFSSSVPLEVTLVWTDPPGEVDANHPLVNDLDLVVRSPAGTVYRGNHFSGSASTADPGIAGDSDNNVEQVLVEAPPPGSWTVEVVGTNVVTPPPGLDGQDFALVYSGDAADCDEPQPPANVVATAAGDNRIDLSWDPVAGAVEYAVLRSSTPGGRPYQLLAAVDGGSTTFSDTTVDGGITYYYVLRARTGCWSADSSEVEAATSGPCSVPPVFAGLAEVIDGEGVTCTLRLAWPAAVAPCGGEPSYSVYRGTSPDLEPGAANRIASGIVATSFSDAGLDDGRVYYYVVRAVDGGNGLDDGNAVVLSGVPSGPDGVYLSSAGDSAEGWLADTGAADTGTAPWHFDEVEFHSAPSAWHCGDEDRVKDQRLVLSEPLRLPAGTAAVLEFWQLFGLQEERDGGRLEYSVDGGSTWHDILAGNGYSVPDDPGRLLAGGYNHTLARLLNANPLAGEQAWSGLSRGWQRVVVELADFAGQPLLLRWRLGCNADSSEGHGWWLDDLRIIEAGSCQSCLAAAAPTGLVAEAQQRGILLTWDGVAGATEHRVLRSSRFGEAYRPVAAVAAPATRFFDTLVSGGTTYRYAVQADTGCLSEVSAEVRAEALGPCLLPPVFYGLSSATAASEPACAVDLAWPEAVSSCPGSSPRYRIYRSTEALSFVPDGSTMIADGVVATTYRDLRVRDGVTYHYVVRAVDQTNLRPDSNTKPLAVTVRGADEDLFADAMESGDGSWITLVGSPADSGTEPWTLLATGDGENNHAWFCSDEPQVKDQVLQLAQPVTIPEGVSATLELDQRFDFDVLWDGGRLEYSTDGGTTWHDILAGDGATLPANPDRFITGGYNGTLLSLPATNPLAGARAWTGRRGDWDPVRVDLADFGGTSLLLRWRLGCDSVKATVGWWIDNVRLFYVAPCAMSVRDSGVRVR